MNMCPRALLPYTHNLSINRVRADGALWLRSPSPATLGNIRAQEDDEAGPDEAGMTRTTEKTDLLC